MHVPPAQPFVALPGPEIAGHLADAGIADQDIRRRAGGQDRVPTFRRVHIHRHRLHGDARIASQRFRCLIQRFLAARDDGDVRTLLRQ